MEVAIKLLGPIGLWTDGQRHDDLGSLKEQGVLAILAMECDRPVRVSALISRLWDHPPAHARETLSSYVSRLRRRLKKASAGQIFIASTRDAYQLIIDPDQVDLSRFRRLRRQADAIADSGDDEHAIELLRAAENLWRGDALGDLPGSWMQRVRDGLAEEGHMATLERIDIDLRLGHHSRVLGELHQLAARHPLDERIGAHLMTALYRCDRHADALGKYQEIRTLLVQTLGAEPGPRLQEVHRRILADDLDLAVTPRYRRSDQPSQPCTLPPDLTDFVGRESELTSLERPNPQVIDVIVGMPGVGKTSLAVRAAHRLNRRYPDAQVFLSLAAHDPARPPLRPLEALSNLLRMIGVPVMRVPSALSDRIALWHAETAHRRTVIVLDDVASEEQIRPLLPSTDSCHVLVTARRSLPELAGARHTQLGVLAISEAASLLADLSGCRNNAHAEKVARLCGRLPLAIRLTASRLRGGEEMADLVREFTIDDPDLATTPVQMEATFELSYQDLDAEEQTILRQLAWHPSDQISEQSAAALTDRPVEAIRPALRNLLANHLIEEVTRTTYGFHDLIRSYVRDRSRRTDPPPVIRQNVGRLLKYYLALADEADRLLYSQRHRPAMAVSREDLLETSTRAREWFASEWSSAVAMVRHAIKHEWKEQGGQLAFLISKYLVQRGFWEEASSVLSLALRATQDTAHVALELAFVCFLRGDHQIALEHAGEALAISRQNGDVRAGAEALDRIGIAHWACGRYREALAHGQESLRLYRSVHDYAGEAAALNHIGIDCWHLGRYDEATANIKSALSIYQRTDDLHGTAVTLNNMGDIQQSRGYHRDAMELYQRSLEIFDQVLGHHNHAILYSNIGSIHRYKGEYSKALSSYRSAVAIYRETGDSRDMADALNSIGVTYRQMGQYSEALVHHQKARAIALDIKNPYEHTRALLGIAATHQEIGRYPLALEFFESALTAAREIGDLYQEAKVHDGIAGVALRTTGPEAARIHWRQALDIYQNLNVPEANTVDICLQALDEMAS